MTAERFFWWNHTYREFQAEFIHKSKDLLPSGALADRIRLLCCVWLPPILESLAEEAEAAGLDSSPALEAMLEMDLLVKKLLKEFDKVNDFDRAMTKVMILAKRVQTKGSPPTVVSAPEVEGWLSKIFNYFTGESLRDKVYAHWQKRPADGSHKEFAERMAGIWPENSAEWQQYLKQNPKVRTSPGRHWASMSAEWSKKSK